MDKRLIKNIYFCFILPAFIGSLSGLGIFTLMFKTWTLVFGIPFLVFVSGVFSFFVGLVMKSIYKWEEKKE